MMSSAQILESKDEKIRLLRAHLTDHQLDCPLRLEFLVELRGLLYDRFCQRHDLNALQEIIRNDMESIQMTSVTHVNHGIRAGNLGMMYLKLRRQTGKLSDLARAVYFGRYANAILPQYSSSASRIHLKNQLATSLLQYADRKGTIKFYDEAVTLADAVVMANCPNKKRHSEYLDNLGNALRQRYLLNKDPQDIKEAVRNGLEAINASPDREQKLLEAHNLGFSLSISYGTTHDPEDLRKAIQYTKISLEDSLLSPDAKADRISNLGNMVAMQWQISRSDKDLEKAITYFNQALNILRPEHPQKRHVLAQMGAVLDDAYQVNHRLQYLDAAIETSRNASNLKAITARSELLVLSNLGTQLQRRYQRVHNLKNLEESIRLFAKAVEMAPPRSSPRTSLLESLSNAYQSRYDKLHDPHDLRTSLTLIEDAYNNSPISFSPTSWLNAADKYLALYRVSTNARDLKSVQERVQNAVSSPNVSNSPNQWMVYGQAGNIYYDLYGLNGAQESLDLSIAYYLACWESEAAVPIKRIKAVRRAAKLFCKAGQFREAWSLLREAVALIPVACPQILDREDQQFVISQLSGLSADACSAGLAAGVHALDALEILERGRGIITASVHRAVAELMDLKAQSPVLYQEFEDLRMKINTNSIERGSDFDEDQESKSTDEFAKLKALYEINRSSNEVTSSDREKYLKELEQVIRKIRHEVPGLENFLQPMEKSRIQGLAKDGAIVVLVASSIRTDAIILTETGIQVLPLPLSDPTGITLEKAAGQMARLCVEEEPRPLFKRNSILMGLLAWLWRSVCGPVCQALHFEGQHHPNGLPPRIWWIPTGLFAWLPLHAAGRYVDDCSDTVLRRAVSTYITNFRMLDFVRSQDWSFGKSELSGMLITMPTSKTADERIETKDELFVRTASEEATEIVREGSKIQWHREEFEKPSAKKVLDELPKYNLVHVCSHGISDPIDPGKSHLVLWKHVTTPDSDIRNMDRLTVSAISRAQTKKAVLVYLSACSTADVRAPALLDEGLHIGNAFQLAGFPHVIATLWPASDLTCPLVARWFYHFLSSWSEEEPLNSFRIALALQLAMCKAMAKYKHQPILWAPFIHQGQ
jgi:tetratricopeptide (TPR) repeat protein